MERAYRSFDVENEGFEWKDVNKAFKAVEGEKYSGETIQAFIDRVLVIYQGEDRFQVKAGYFLSALLQNNGDDEVRLDIRHLKPLHHLCCELTRRNGKIIFQGDVGDYLGHNAGDRLNNDEKHTSNLVVVVEGNAGDHAGSHFNGRYLIVDGKGGRECGEFCRGEVWIKKGIESRGEKGVVLTGT
jgi:hypothetical protein